MTWFVVDDGFWGHPKVTGLSGEAIALWTQAGSWCCRYLTDGVMPLDIAKKLGRKQRAVGELLSANLWETDQKSISFHDWSDYQDTRATVLERRKHAAERKQKSRMSRCESAGSHDEVREESRVAAVLSPPNLSSPILPSLRSGGAADAPLPHEPEPSAPEKPRDTRKAVFVATWKSEARAAGFEATPDCPAKQRDQVIRMATESAESTGRSFPECLRARIAGGLADAVRLDKAPKWCVVDWDPRAASRPAGGAKVDYAGKLAELRGQYSLLEGQLAAARVVGGEREQRASAELEKCRAEMRAVKQAGGL